MTKASVVPIISRATKREPKDTVKLVNDMREDSIFRLGIKVIQSLMSSASITVDELSASPDNRSSVVSAHIFEVWKRYLASAMESIEYGRQAFEIVWKYDPFRGIHAIDEMIPIPFELSTPIFCPDTGDIKGVKVSSKGDSVTLEKDSFWWASIQSTPLEPYGKSIYRGAPWKVRCQRREQDENEKNWYSRLACGIGVARAPEDPIGPPIAGKGDMGELDIAGMPIDPMVVLRSQLDLLRAGGFAILSSARDPISKEYLYSIDMQPEMKDSTSLANRRKQLDIDALRSLGIPDRAVMQDDATGSKATSQVHFDVLCFVVETFLRQIVDSFTRDVIDPLVRMNFGGRSKIRMSWRQIGDKSADRFDELVRTVLTSENPSPLITHAVVDFMDMCKTANVPLGKNPTEALSEVAEEQEAKNAPQNSGFGGFGFGSSDSSSGDNVPDPSTASGDVVKRALSIFRATQNAVRQKGRGRKSRNACCQASA